MDNIKLYNKYEMPVLGLGTWRSEPGKVGKAVEQALLVDGYTHIDCAHIYGNEPEIGQAFKSVFNSGKVNREDIFITSKLWNTDHDPKHVEKACRTTLKNLKLAYLDLYLIHWGIAFKHGSDNEPIGKNGVVKTEPVSIQKTWQAMEQLVEKGLVKNIGVANFTAPMLVDLLTYTKVHPAINQIEIHPYNTQEALVEYCHKVGIQITAYSPLGSSGKAKDRPLTDPLIIELATKYKKTPAQILIRWAIQRGLTVIPKTVTPKRVKENSEVFNINLTKTEMAQINKLNKNYRYVEPSQWWGVPYFG